MTFLLDQSPPKRDLKVSDPKVRDLTLAELQLAPSSVLLLRFEDESLNSSSRELGHDTIMLIETRERRASAIVVDYCRTSN